MYWWYGPPCSIDNVEDTPLIYDNAAHHQSTNRTRNCTSKSTAANSNNALSSTVFFRPFSFLSFWVSFRSYGFVIQKLQNVLSSSSNPHDTSLHTSFSAVTGTVSLLSFLWGPLYVIYILDHSLYVLMPLQPAILHYPDDCLLNYHFPHY
jgi:hypothetical protein